MSSSFRDLTVWRKAKQLSIDVYRVTKDFPREEAYGLTSQVRRAAISVVSNIAEGQGRLKGLRTIAWRSPRDAVRTN